MKYLSLFLAAALWFGLLGCNREKKRVIGIVPKGRAQMFWQSVHAGANKAAREANIEIIWNGPASETDYNGQLQIVDAMINRRVDAIAVAPIDRKVIVSAVERAMREKIPVIIFDSGIDTEQFVSQIATDNYRAGEVAAERVGKLLNGKGKVAMVMVQPGAGSTMAREDGFRNKLAKDYPGIRIVAQQYGFADYAKSLTAAENMLTAHPDLDILFASNESSTVGAAQALKSRKSPVKLVGFDSSPSLIEDLKAGAIESLVVQDPFFMGYESVRSAVAHLNGETVPKINSLEPSLVNLENLNTPEVQARINPDLKKYLE
jgi:ribose transport system substrate-binding protein